jgi:hypothetical protein
MPRVTKQWREAAPLGKIVVVGVVAWLVAILAMVVLGLF